MGKTVVLSKSRYIRGMQCVKAMYLDTFRKELAEVDEKTLRSFDAGRDFEKSFKDTFLNAVDISARCGPRIGRYADITAQLLHASTGPLTLFEAGFVYDGVLVLADVFQRTAEGVIQIFEVKNNTKPKNVFRNDLFLQYYVIAHALCQMHEDEEALQSSCLAAAIDSFDLVLREENEDHRVAFHCLDLTQEAVREMPVVKARVAKFKTILQGVEPTVSQGEWCGDPYECPYRSYCRGEKAVQLELSLPVE